MWNAVPREGLASQGCREVDEAMSGFRAVQRTPSRVLSPEESSPRSGRSWSAGSREKSPPSPTTSPRSGTGRTAPVLLPKITKGALAPAKVADARRGPFWRSVVSRQPESLRAP